jgi:hypothetical protein
VPAVGGIIAVGNIEGIRVKLEDPTISIMKVTRLTRATRAGG